MEQTGSGNWCIQLLSIATTNKIELLIFILVGVIFGISHHIADGGDAPWMRRNL
jgi:hypothetical protein